MPATALPAPVYRETHRSRHRWWLVLSALLAIALLFVLGWVVVGGITWLRYGRASTTANSDSVITRLIPTPEVAEHHERVVAAPPAVVWARVHDFDMQQSPIVRAIFRTRQLMLRGSNEPMARTPFLQDIEGLGWQRVASNAPRDLAYAAVTQPWNAEVIFHGLPAERFVSFDSAGYTKIAWSIGVDSLGPNLSRVRTDTRVTTTDAEARRRFRRYWAVFSPGIMVIRYEALRVIGRAAERTR